jgi:C1A family cysteine protease
MRVEELRQILASQNASWKVNEQLSDADLIPLHPLGASVDTLPRAEQTTRLDLHSVLSHAPANPMLLERYVAYGLISADAAASLKNMRPVTSAIQAPPPVSGTVRAKSIDWRNRWGWPWITSVQDQDPCESCWAFCATGVVESMVRIEHAVWSKRSEGDVHDGIGGKKCADGGSPDAALNWITAHGICDLACYPYKTDDSPYGPTPDRGGRTVKIPAHVQIGDIEQQKSWLDAVGPLGVTFSVYHDFDGYHSGVYRKTPTSPTNYFRGTHCVLIVGYDDAQSAWLIKNSWGSGWGDHGYVWIGYGEADIDTWAKLGVQNTNPDPWTKRRMHSGNTIESGNGAAHRNFEMLATAGGGNIRHWWREGGDFSWHQATIFGNDAAVCPTLTGTTYNRNFESVHLTLSGRLHHWIFDQASGHWLDGGIFGPLDATGIPGFIQSNYGTPGNFEVVVSTRTGQLNHWWRMNGAPWTWSDGGRFASNIAFSGASLVQSRHGGHGNLELVAMLNTGQMQHWWRDDDHGFIWNAGAIFGGSLSSPPCMIEGQYGATDENRIGNFELCVAVGGRAQHWWYNNQGDLEWRLSDTFGHDIRAVASLVEGSFGFNLEVIVLRADNQLQHYWRDGGGWHEGVVIGPA